MPKVDVQLAVDSAWAAEEYRSRRPQGFPGRSRGVYLFFDQSDALIYVGKACWNFDKRIWGHYSSKKHWKWIDIIPFEDEWWFLIPALEAFLIARLHPRDNKEYRGYP